MAGKETMAEPPGRIEGTGMKERLAPRQLPVIIPEKSREGG